MRLSLAGLLLISMLLVNCKEGAAPASSLDDLDLMSHGLPIKIKAPAGAEVVTEDMGFIKDVTVKGEGNYFLQILGSEVSTTDIAAIVSSQKEAAKNSPFFSEIVSEDANGFIFKKQITPERINYDFRSIKIQGDQEYVFQMGMMGNFSLDEVKTMYAAVK